MLCNAMQCNDMVGSLIQCNAMLSIACHRMAWYGEIATSKPLSRPSCCPRSHLSHLCRNATTATTTPWILPSRIKPPVHHISTPYQTAPPTIPHIVKLSTTGQSCSMRALMGLVGILVGIEVGIVVGILVGIDRGRITQVVRGATGKPSQRHSLPWWAVIMYRSLLLCSFQQHSSSVSDSLVISPPISW